MLEEPPSSRRQQQGQGRARLAGRAEEGFGGTEAQSLPASPPWDEGQMREVGTERVPRGSGPHVVRS